MDATQKEGADARRIEHRIAVGRVAGGARRPLRRVRVRQEVDAENIAELVTGDPGLVDRINRHTWSLSDGAIVVVGPPDSQQAHDVHQALEDTGLFKKGTIAHIPPQDLAGAARADLIILTEDALSAQADGPGRARLLEDVLSRKRGIHAGLIGYAPAGDLTDSEFQAIGSEPITSVTRTRGRLVNDAISMLTTLSRVQGQ